MLGDGLSYVGLFFSEEELCDGRATTTEVEKIGAKQTRKTPMVKYGERFNRIVRAAKGEQLMAEVC